MKRYTLVSAVVLTVLFVVTATAQQNTDTGTAARRPAGQMMGRGMMGGEMMGSMNTMGYVMNRMIQAEWELYLRHRDELALTVGQVEELQDVRIEYLRLTNDTRGELEITTQELEDMLSADEFNLNEVSRKISDVHDLLVELEVEQVTAVADARDILTTGQREQARILRRQGRRGMMDDRGLMHGVER